MSQFNYRAPDFRTSSIELGDRRCRVMFSLAQPRLALVDGFIDEAESRHLLASVAGVLAPATVFREQSGLREVSELRTGWSAKLPKGGDEILRRIERRAAVLAGLDVALAEPVEVIRYEPGQLYRPHYDWFDAATPGGRTRIESMGQRLATVLIYLSDVAEGGSTRFPVLGLDVRPARGRALFFANVDDRGETDRRALHGGAPVVTGCKQIATCWFSSRRERQSLDSGQAASEV
jgi:prolyl 4-hydroxylase